MAKHNTAADTRIGIARFLFFPTLLSIDNSPFSRSTTCSPNESGSRLGDLNNRNAAMLMIPSIGRRGNEDPAGSLKTILICTEDVVGKSGRAIRCGCDVSDGKPCVNRTNHLERPVPFSLRMAYGPAVTAYYLYGIKHRTGIAH